MMNNEEEKSLSNTNNLMGKQKSSFDQNVKKRKIGLKNWIALAVIFYSCIGLVIYYYFFYNNKPREVESIAIAETKPTIEKQNSEDLIKVEKTQPINNTEFITLETVERELTYEQYNEAGKNLIILVNQGNNEAVRLLAGLIYFWAKGEDIEGTKIERNDTLFIECFKCLLDKSNEEMEKRLLFIPLMLTMGKDEKGNSIETNYSLAGDCLTLLADKGNKEAKDLLIKLHNDGLITDTSYNNSSSKENNNYNKNSMNEQSQPESIVEYDMDDNKVFIELKSNIGDYALGAAKVVKDFYTNYLNHNCRIDNWETNKNLMPLTRQIFLMLNFVGFDYLDYDFIVNGQDYGNIWKINTVQVKRDTALVGIENSWNGEGSRNLKIVCKYVNGKWFIDDIEEAKKVFYSFLNSNLTLGVVNSYELPIFSKKYKQQNIPFYDSKNRIIPLKFNSLDSYQIISDNNLDNKIDSKLYDSEWFVKSESVITFNFLNKVKKGADKYLAYIVLGEPSEDSSNKLFYSPNDYISYDKDGKIISWVGFEDIKEFFDDGSSSNNQNIGYVNAKSGINLRKEPNTKSDKICGFPFNTKVVILDANGPQATFERITSNWYLVSDGTKVGWAFGGFIKEN